MHTESAKIIITNLSHCNPATIIKFLITSDKLKNPKCFHYQTIWIKPGTVLRSREIVRSVRKYTMSAMRKVAVFIISNDWSSSTVILIHTSKINILLPPIYRLKLSDHAYEHVSIAFASFLVISWIWIFPGEFASKNLAHIRCKKFYSSKFPDLSKNCYRRYNERRN